MHIQSLLIRTSTLTAKSFSCSFQGTSLSLLPNTPPPNKQTKKPAKLTSPLSSLLGTPACVSPQALPHGVLTFTQGQDRHFPLQSPMG